MEKKHGMLKKENSTTEKHSKYSSWDIPDSPKKETKPIQTDGNIISF